MLLPPVSTPISRMIAMAASRIRWYSLSVSVWAGATVIESPVCTPIGSKFSMEQMMTTLSATSRITSSSYSFQPMTDSSIEHLVDRAEFQAAGDELVELLAVEQYDEVEEAKNVLLLRLDLVVEGKVIVDLKAKEQVNEFDKARLLSYLSLSNLRLGLIINFHSVLLKDGTSRVVNGLQLPPPAPGSFSL